MKKFYSLESRSEINFIFLIFFTAFLIRFFFFLWVINQQPQKFKVQDYDGYVQIAINIIDRGIYSRDFGTQIKPDITRPPIYPLTLACLLVLGGSNGNTIVLFQILLGVVVVILTYFLARELRLEKQFAFAAAILMALDPLLILLGHYFLSEILFLLEWLAALWLLVRFLNTQSTKFLINSSILLALATLTRPILQFYPLLIILIILIFFLRKNFWIGVRNSILYIGIFLLIIFPWAMRNKIVSGVFTLSTIPDTNLYFYRAEAVLADAENISLEAAHMRLNNEIIKLRSEHEATQSRVQNYMRIRALAIMVQYPIHTLKMTIIGAVRLLVDPGYSLICTALDPSNLTLECFPGEATMITGNVFSLMWTRFLTMGLFQKTTLIFSTISMIFLYLGSIVGTFILIRQKQWLSLVITWGSSLYIIILSTGAESLYRLRVPILPLLSILTGISLHFLARRKQFMVKSSETERSFEELSA